MESEVVHQLKNQLALIVAFTDLMLQDAGTGDRRRDDVVELHKAARAALALMPEVAKRLQ